jgi:hypothetical protein
VEVVAPFFFEKVLENQNFIFSYFFLGASESSVVALFKL